MKSLFDQQKTLATSKADLSRKGSVDEEIRGLITALNCHPDLFTLSSCSGRIVLFRAEGSKKKGCQWIWVSHQHWDPESAWRILEAAQAEEEIPQEDENLGILTLKFEPFILHLQCRTLELAKRVHTLR